MVKLFQIRSVAYQLCGHKNVTLDWFVEKRDQMLFGPNGSLAIPSRDVIRDYNTSDPELRLYPEITIEEYFTAAEAEAFVAWVRLHRVDQTATIIRVWCRSISTS